MDSVAKPHPSCHLSLRLTNTLCASMLCQQREAEIIEDQVAQPAQEPEPAQKRGRKSGAATTPGGLPVSDPNLEALRANMMSKLASMKRKSSGVGDVDGGEPGGSRPVSTKKRRVSEMVGADVLGPGHCRSQYLGGEGGKGLPLWAVKELVMYPYHTCCMEQ